MIVYIVMWRYAFVGDEIVLVTNDETRARKEIDDQNESRAYKHGYALMEKWDAATGKPIRE